MLSTYLLLNIIIIAFPLLASFESRVSYYKKFIPLLKSILLVGGFFVIWDIIVTFRGHWAFNKLHVGEVLLFTIPIEEVLFFITVPFSCLFIWEVLNYFNKNTKINFKNDLIKKMFYFISIILFGLAVLFFNKEYTFVVLMITALTIIFVNFKTKLFENKNFYYFSLITLGLFIIFNYILTSIPIVTYSETAILNLRILTIPVEDFFYNFSMLALYLVAFLFFKKEKF